MLEGLDHGILLGFIGEAQSYIPAIRVGIAAFCEDRARLEIVQQAYRHVHTIHGAALMIGLEDLSELAVEIENALEPFQTDAGDGLSSPEAARLLAQLTAIEILLQGKAEEFGRAADQPQDFGEFDDIEARQTGAAAESAPVDFDRQTALIDEDIDPEMLEVFAEEAEEHLTVISQNLSVLEQNPRNREALLNVRRSSHTLKGAAAVVGFKTTASLAHRMEDLLDDLYERSAPSNHETTALLLASTDLLERLSRGQNQAALQPEINRLYDRYQSILTPAAENQVAPDEPPTASESLIEPAAPESSLTAAPPTAVAATNVVELRPSALIDDEQTAVSSAPRTVVRVELERLDEMVKLMGEMVIGRTILEQRLLDIENQLTEMQLSTVRLRRITGKLEVDYEASQLQNTNFAVPLFGQPSPNLALAQLLKSSTQNQPLNLSAAPTQTTAKQNGFDDLELDRYTEFHQLTRELVETSSDTSSITGEMNDLIGDLEGLLTRQRRLSDELQDKLMRLRMIPLSTLAIRLQRTVRVTADSENKLVDLEIEGEGVEIDTQVLASLAEPLLHLLKNSVVHGIETTAARIRAGKPERGLISLRAYHEGTHIIISITDDGGGMNAAALRDKALGENFISLQEAEAMTDEQALQLIFLPGFSTAKRLTENAGRGVGMDVVRDSVVRQGGTVSLRTTPGRSTTISIRLPMSLAVTRSLLVKAHGRRFAIPLNMIEQLAQVAAEDFDQLTQENILWIGGNFYPVFALNELLELPVKPVRETGSQVPVLLINTGEADIALVIEEIIEARELVLKPLVTPLGRLRGLLSASVLGDGSVVPVLDLVTLINTGQNRHYTAQPAATHVYYDAPPTTPTVVTAAETHAHAEPAPIKSAAAQISVLIVDDSPSVRRVMQNFVTKSGFTPLLAKDGIEAVELLQTARILPDVILSDVEMPRMDGFELLAALKRQDEWRNIPVVMITSRAGDKHRTRAVELGASDYVVKPYQDSVLLDTIKALAGEKIGL